MSHIPKGNPANAHTITIEESAVDAHVRNHGDVEGNCDSEEAQDVINAKISEMNLVKLPKTKGKKK